MVARRTGLVGFQTRSGAKNVYQMNHTKCKEMDKDTTRDWKTQKYGQWCW